MGNTALKAGHTVSIFLMGAGVEIECIKDSKFDVAGTLRSFINAKGNLLACGTCLKSRQQEEGVCPVSTMPQLVELIANSDKVISIG
jgi:uncharacterized protein involved in oxidation of intracellular sulfur